MNNGIPETEPQRVVAGDRVRWDRVLPDHSADDGWEATYYLLGESAQSHKIVITTTGDGDRHSVDASTAVTAAWVSGRYRWQLVAAKTGDRATLDHGSIEIGKDFASAKAEDTRSHDRKVLEAIEAVLERRASKDQESFSIEGRSLARTPLAELVRLRNQYAARVRLVERGPAKVVARF